MFTAAVVWFKPACNCQTALRYLLGYLRCNFFAFCVKFCKKQHAFSHSQKIVFVSQFKKNVCFVFCGLTGTRAKQFALGYPLHCALFAFRKFCKSQHAFSHSQKIVFVSQFKKRLFCVLLSNRYTYKKFSVDYLLRCVP